MPDERDSRAEQEQLERRRLSRLIDALPVFSGFTSPDGHIIQSRPETSESFLWAVPSFAYSHDSISQIVDLCELASKGERVQVERAYLKERTGPSDIYGRGLLTLTPVRDGKGHVDELAVTFIDCDDNGLTPQDPFAKSRLTEANARIESMLSLAQTVIENFRSADRPQQDRDKLSDRLDALASVIDSVSDPDIQSLGLNALLATAFETVPAAMRKTRLKTLLDGGNVPVASVPLMTLLLSELVDNARRHGALRDTDGPYCGSVSIQSDVLDSAQGRVLRLHWIEDGGPRVSAALGRGFGLVLGERLFPQITGGKSHLLNLEDGLSWTFELPVPDGDDFDFDGIDA
ncbi:HWE histidine kinase domain-containing protein [uncultured Algimonas sp.]|uniref:HWE histidine kinase domain-containing protein n=1 Tax=uncultured Algimonas sp. TaxID=1547920 RepID=UPI00262730C2|nr:HWE histidine kinase domain-containing protein [uncultured Algimonas sp.]